jgi:uncharacterized protein YsxB (DUF464 family)
MGHARFGAHNADCVESAVSEETIR